VVVTTSPEVAVGVGGDRAAFGRLFERHRRELHVHCYRMLGSFDDAEDLVQETFVRAWQRRDSFVGGPYFRAWLYRIATNACLDSIRRRHRRAAPATGGAAVRSYADIPWIQPYPDRLLDEIAATDDGPDAVVIARETIELAFLAALQLLPPRQRAVLIMRDVLGWTANETAAAIQTSVAAANSALQRARARLVERLPDRPGEWRPAQPTAEERDLLERFIDSHERGDIDAAVAMLREDVRVTMPPYPYLYEGVLAVSELARHAFSDEMGGDWRLLPTWSNRQPAAGSYFRAEGDDRFRAFKLDVLRVVGGGIAEITTFGPSTFPGFGLPEILPPNMGSSARRIGLGDASS
jgi:RNA polymerase sigma-70 factor (ECF subfamily)